jgi:sigma-B regulation protein RsbU (phosphoserine phosphatase)
MHAPGGISASPAEIIGRVNRELCENNSDLMFVTLFFAMLSPDNGRLEFCNAGHNAPYWLKGNKLEAVEEPKGIILGVRSDAVYETGLITLSPGESIYVFSDGVTEASNQEGEMFGEQRLEAVLQRSADHSSAEIVKSVTAAVRGFVGAAPPSDDITMLAVRRLDQSSEQFRSVPKT